MAGGPGLSAPDAAGVIVARTRHHQSIVGREAAGPQSQRTALPWHAALVFAAERHDGTGMPDETHLIRVLKSRIRQSHVSLYRRSTRPGVNGLLVSAEAPDASRPPRGRHDLGCETAPRHGPRRSSGALSAPAGPSGRSWRKRRHPRAGASADLTQKDRSAGPNSRFRSLRAALTSVRPEDLHGTVVRGCGDEAVPLHDEHIGLRLPLSLQPRLRTAERASERSEAELLAEPQPQASAQSPARSPARTRSDTQRHADAPPRRGRVARLKDEPEVHDLTSQDKDAVAVGAGRGRSGCPSCLWLARDAGRSRRQSRQEAPGTGRAAHLKKRGGKIRPLEERGFSPRPSAPVSARLAESCKERSSASASASSALAMP